MNKNQNRGLSPISLGTPQLATTKDGQTSWKAQSEAFGAAGVLQAQSTIEMNLRFPGQYFDQESGSALGRCRNGGQRGVVAIPHIFSDSHLNEF